MAYKNFLNSHKFRISSTAGRSIKYSPDFYEFLLQSILNTENKKLCFIFDKKPIDTHLIAIITSLALFKKHAPGMIEKYSEKTFKKGENVIVQPQGYIFKYGGLFKEEGRSKARFLRLNLLDGTGARTFKPHDLLRLQSTQKVRPKGTLRHSLTVDEITLIDSLLDITTFDNHSFLSNLVLLYSSKNKFDNTLSDVALHNIKNNKTASLRDLKLWGGIDREGELKSYDTRQSGGEPILAVSSEMEDIANYLENQPEYSRVVFFDELHKIGNNLHVFDEITDNQYSIVIGSINEMEDITQYLDDTGFAIWQLGAGDFYQFNKSQPVKAKSPIDLDINFPVISNQIKNQMKMKYLYANDQILDEAAKIFNDLARYINKHEIEDNISELVARIFQILYENISLTFYPDITHINELENIKQEFKQLQAWMEPDFYDSTIKCIDLNIDHQNSLDVTKFTQKGEMIRNLVKKNKSSKIMILSRDSEKSKRTEKYFEDLKYNIYTDAIKNIYKQPTQKYDIVCLDYWPGKSKFLKLYSSQLCHNLIFAGYPLEMEWCRNTISNLNKDLKKYRLNKKRKLKLLSIDETDYDEFKHKIRSLSLPKIKLTESEDSQNTEDIEPPTLVFNNNYLEKKRNKSLNLHSNGQDSVKTRLTEYKGNYYSWNQDTHEVILLENLSEESSASLKVNTIKANKLKLGDIVLIRSNSDKSVITDTAQDIIGSMQYEDLYKKAVSWKKALENISRDPKVLQRKLKKNGLDRNILTVKNWMSSKTIGPSNIEDLKTIIIASRNAKLQNELDNIWSAITTIKGLHIQAGHKLTDIVLKEIRSGSIDFTIEEEQEIKLEHGDIQLLEITYLAEDTKLIDRSQANHIHKYKSLTI